MRSLLALAVLATPAIAAPRVTPSHVVDVWYAWPKPTATVAVTMKVTVDPGIASSYYWSHFFQLEGNRAGTGNERQLYMGLQTTGGGKRAVIFSAWNAVEAGPGCEAFGGEGAGYKCFRAYDWTAGHGYRFEARAIGNDWWRGTVTNTTTGVATVIGQLRMPVGAGRAITSVLFDEIYREVASCAAITPASVTFSELTGADGMKPRYGSTVTPAPCGSLATVDVTDERVIVTTGTIAGAAPSLKNLDGWLLDGDRVTRGDRCLDSEGGASSAGTRVIAWSCHRGANQRWVRRGSGLALAGSDQCVTSISGELRLSPCNLTFQMAEAD